MINKNVSLSLGVGRSETPRLCIRGDGEEEGCGGRVQGAQWHQDLRQQGRGEEVSIRVVDSPHDHWSYFLRVIYKTSHHLCLRKCKQAI